MQTTISGSAACGPTVTSYNRVVASLGKAIRQRREALVPRLSQTELGKKVGFGQALVSQWERDETVPDAVQLAAIAMALGCTVEEVVADGISDYNRWRRDLARHSGTENESQTLHSQGGPTDAAAATRAFLEKVQADYRTFYDDVQDLARQLKETADRQPDIIRTIGPRKDAPHRSGLRRRPRGHRRTG